MFKAINISYIIVLVLVATQQYSFAQIISENKLANTPTASVLQYSDNEFIYVGTESNPNRNEYNVTLTKKDLNGNLIWGKNIEWNFDCTVKDAAILSDNTIIIAGSARKSTYQSYPFVMKTDVNGDTLWTRYYKTGHQAEKIIGTSDGGYLFAYYSNGSGLMKLNANGDTIWTRKVSNGKPYGLAETSEAVYLMVDDEDENIVLHSIGSSGEILWTRIFGGSGKDQPANVINAKNGDDYVVAGTSYSNQTGDDFFIGFLNCFGFVAWTKTFGGPGTDLCFDLLETPKGEFIAVGISNSFNKNGNFDFYAVKFNSWGDVIWTKTIPGENYGTYLAQNVFETSYGSYLIAGRKLSNSAPTKESFIVEFVYPTQFDISFESDKQIITNSPFSVQLTNNTPNVEYYDFVWYFGDGESLASNNDKVFHEYKENGLYNVKLVAYENDFGSVDSLVYKDYINIKGITTSARHIESEQTPKLSIQPNPFTTNTIISFDNPYNDLYTLKIINQNGKIVKELDNIRGSSIEINRSNLHSGIYLVELRGKITSRAKLMIQ